MRKRTLLALVALMAAIAMLAAACGGDDDDSGAADTGSSTPEGPTITIRGQDFSESATIAEVYGQYLKAKGYDVNILEPAGFRTEAFSSCCSSRCWPVSVPEAPSPPNGPSYTISPP